MDVVWIASSLHKHNCTQHKHRLECQTCAPRHHQHARARHEQTTRMMQVGFSAVRFSSEAAKKPAEILYKGAFCRPRRRGRRAHPQNKEPKEVEVVNAENTSGRGGRLLVTLRGEVFLRGPEDTCGELVQGGVLSTKGPRQASAPPNRGGGSLPTRTTPRGEEVGCW